MHIYIYICVCLKKKLTNISIILTIGHDGSQLHGPNAVISMLDHALTFYGYGEKGAVMHCDNCGGKITLFSIYFQLIQILFIFYSYNVSCLIIILMLN